LKVLGVFATSIDESADRSIRPWDNLIHQALKEAQAKLNFTYEWSDENGYGSDFDQALRTVAAEANRSLSASQTTIEYDIIIFGDDLANEDNVRKIAKEFPKVYFVFASTSGPMGPNLAVFYPSMHESAYLAGMAAGILTKNNTIGVVGGYAVGEVNRIINSFKLGGKTVNPDAKFYVTFIDSAYNPGQAKKDALAFIDAGADILYAETAGVIQAARERAVYAVGHVVDQHDIAPGTVITSVVWDAYPLVEYVVNSVQGGMFVSMDLREWTMLAKGGTYVAPYRDFDKMIPLVIKDRIDATIEEIKEGLFRVPVDETTPTSD